MLRVRSWLHSLVTRFTSLPGPRRSRKPAREKPSRLIIEELEVRLVPDGDPSRLLPSFAQFPLAFEANQGQTDPQVQFLARGNGYGLFRTPTAAVLSLVQAPATGRRPRPWPLRKPRRCPWCGCSCSAPTPGRRSWASTHRPPRATTSSAATRPSGP